MSMTNEAARMVAALVNKPLDEIVALDDRGATYRNVVTGFSIELGRMFKGDVPLRLKEIGAIHRTVPVDLKVNAEGLVSVVAGTFGSRGYKTLPEVLAVLQPYIARASHRTPMKALTALVNLSEQAISMLAAPTAVTTAA